MCGAAREKWALGTHFHFGGTSRPLPEREADPTKQKGCPPRSSTPLSYSVEPWLVLHIAISHHRHDYFDDGWQQRHIILQVNNNKHE